MAVVAGAVVEDGMCGFEVVAKMAAVVGEIGDVVEATGECGMWMGSVDWVLFGEADEEALSAVLMGSWDIVPGVIMDGEAALLLLIVTTESVGKLSKIPGVVPLGLRDEAEATPPNGLGLRLAKLPMGLANPLVVPDRWLMRAPGRPIPTAEFRWLLGLVDTAADGDGACVSA